MKTQTQNQTDGATAWPWRVSNRGAGEILNASGNPLNGWEREKIVKQANEYEALNAVVEAAQQIADFNAMSPDDRSAVQDGLGDQPVSEYNGHKLLDALAALAALRGNGGGLP